MERYEKYNSSRFKDQLIQERRGLEALSTTLKATQNSLIKVPKVYAADESIMEMDKISRQRPTQSQMVQLGQGLARLHAQAFEQFGGEENNYIGLLPQPNTWTQNWGEFFLEQRLGFQISLIKNTRVAGEFDAILIKKAPVLSQWLNKHCHHASLVHGDLWIGNVLFDQQDVWLIDPAIYYADREVDIAMTEMFGGFSQSFYQAYDAILPRSEIYPIKRTIYNLYHYLNHYNLFGDSYIGECRAGFKLIQQL